MVTFLQKYALGHTQFLFYFIFLERMGKKIFLGTPLLITHGRPMVPPMRFALDVSK
jgi:hypothetical protein